MTLCEVDIGMIAIGTAVVWAVAWVVEWVIDR